MRLFKKGLLLLLSILMAVSFAGCFGQQQVANESLKLPGAITGESEASAESGAAPEEVKLTQQSECDDDLAGLCKYLEGNYAVAGAKSEMAYEFIGAIAGYKYIFDYEGKSIQTEVYEFDLDNLDETAKEVIQNVENDGKFTVLENEVPAVMSDNGKYLMIYIDNATDEKVVAQKERVLELFKGFKA